MERAKALQQEVGFIDYHRDKAFIMKPNHLTVLSIPCKTAVIPGQLNPINAGYVIEQLTMAVERTLQGEFSAIVTAPVNKAVINQAGISFTGHTEFFRDHCKVSQVVMMLASHLMKVALITTHLPLRDVSKTITQSLIKEVITKLNCSLQNDFAIKNPRIFVAGLNPHAGESGFLGREEIEVITPALQSLKENGIDVKGPFPADTMFTPENCKACDVFVTMYHDQGLPVLKYTSFGHAVNITLGLPIIRTSVDHGSALNIAGKGVADPGSLLQALEMAKQMVEGRRDKDAYH